MDSNAVKSNMIDVAVLDLIKKVKSSIPIEQVQARCKQQPDIDKIAKVDFEQGDIVTHNDQVAFQLDYSPDGSLLATSSFDGTTRVWEISSGEELLTLIGHNHIVYDAKFNFDGSLLVTSSYDGTAIFWDVATGQMLRRIEGQCGSIPSVAFSPDGSHLLTGCQDGTAKLWDVLTGESLLTLEGHEHEFTPDVFGVAIGPKAEPRWRARPSRSMASSICRSTTVLPEPVRPPRTKILCCLAISSICSSR